MLSYIKVNDIFNELIDENKKLRECLKVLIEFKISVDLYLKDITIASDSVNQQKVIQLSKEVEDVFDKEFNGFNNFNEKEIIIETNIISKETPKKKNSKQLLKIKKKSKTKRRKRTPEDEKPFECQQNGCDFKCKSKLTLKIHNSSKHNQNKCEN